MLVLSSAGSSPSSAGGTDESFTSPVLRSTGGWPLSSIGDFHLGSPPPSTSAPSTATPVKARITRTTKAAPRMREIDDDPFDENYEVRADMLHGRPFSAHRARRPPRFSCAHSSVRSLSACFADPSLAAALAQRPPREAQLRTWRRSTQRPLPRALPRLRRIQRRGLGGDTRPRPVGGGCDAISQQVPHTLRGAARGGQQR